MVCRGLGKSVADHPPAVKGFYAAKSVNGATALGSGRAAYSTTGKLWVIEWLKHERNTIMGDGLVSGNPVSKGFLQCPYCGVHVGPQEIRRHIKRLHPHRKEVKVFVRRRENNTTVIVRTSEILRTSESKAEQRAKKASNRHEVISANDKYISLDGTAECVLCHKRLPAGQIELHLSCKHGAFYPKGDDERSNQQWVHVYQGGLPGLGKR